MKAKRAIARKGLLVGGNWVMDQLKLIDVYPGPEQLANIKSQTQGGGGCAHNVLIDLARLGAPFPLWGAGLVGQDNAGQWLLEECRKCHIDTRYLRPTSAAMTSFTDVMSEVGSGRRTFFHYRGANALWRGDDLAFDRIHARFFHLGYLLVLDYLDASDAKYGTRAARLLATAQAAGLTTSIDLVSEEGDRFIRTVRPALRYTDNCILNEIEAGKTAGFKIRKPDGRVDPVAVRHAAGALLQLGVRELVVIHYPEGAFARTRTGVDYWQPALQLPAQQLVSTVGAGDAFCAGVLLGLHEGWGLDRCLLTGVCAATACLADLTCTGGVKPLAPTLALAKRLKFQPPLDGIE